MPTRNINSIVEFSCKLCVLTENNKVAALEIVVIMADEFVKCEHSS